MNIEDIATGRPEDLPAICRELVRRGMLAEADGLLDAALDNSPDDGDLWQIRGQIRRRQGDFGGAREALETATLLVPLNPQARCTLAECYARTGQEALAGVIYRGLARDARCPTELLPAVASGLGSLGDDSSALAACREILRRDPSRHEAHFGAAYYLRRLGHPDVAILAALTQAFELAPGVPLYRVTLASVLSRIGEHDEAYDLLRGVDPRTIGCRCCLGRMMTVFLRVGDLARFGACRDRSQQIHDA